MRMQSSLNSNSRLLISLLLTAAVLAVLSLAPWGGGGPSVSFGYHVDPVPTVGFDSATSSGGEGISPVTIGVSLTADAVDHTVTVDYTVTGGTADGGGVDFTLASGILTFAPSVTSASFTITIVNDIVTETAETIIITLSNPLALADVSLGSTTVHTYTILDDDEVDDDDPPPSSGTGEIQTDTTTPTDTTTTDPLDIISGLGKSDDDADRDEALGLIGGLGKSDDAADRDVARDIIGGLGKSDDDADKDVARDIIGGLGSSDDDADKDAATDIIGNLASSTDSDQKSAATDIIGNLASSTDSDQNSVASDIIGNLHTSTDSDQKRAATDIIGNLGASTDADQKSAATDIIGNLHLSTDSDQKSAATDIIGNLGSSTDADQKSAATDIIGNLHTSTDESQKSAATDIIGNLGSSTDESQKSAATDIIGNLGASTDQSQKDAATSIVSNLVTSGTAGQREAATNIMTSLATSQDQTAQNTATTISTDAASNPSDAFAITSVIHDVVNDPIAFANLDIPHQASVLGNKPEPGVKNWRGLTLRSPSIQTRFVPPVSDIQSFVVNSMLSDAIMASANVTLAYEPTIEGATLEAVPFAAQVVDAPPPIDAILTRFREGVGDVGISVEGHTSLPVGVRALSDELTVNSIFTLTPEGFSQEDIITNHVTFFVKKSWMEENGIHPWAIQMNRWDADQFTWVPLLAKLDSEDEENIFYTVAPPGFSLWAITGAPVLPPERFEDSTLQISPATAVVGEEITVQVFVSNLTDEDAEYNAVLWVDSDVDSSQNVIIPAKTTATIIFTTTLEEGDHAIRIGKQLGDLTVAAPAPAPTATPVPPAATVVPAATAVPPTAAPPIAAPPQPTQAPAATAVPPTQPPPAADEDDDNNLLIIIIVVVAVVVVLLGGGLVVMRRRA